MDKVARLGIRVQDVFDESILRQKVEGSLRQKNELLVKVYNRRDIVVDEIVDYFLAFAERLRPLVIDSTLVLNNALDEGKVVLMEGGQATFLDVDHGTYPFVTSSNPTAGGASVGSGIGPPGSPAPSASSRPTPPVLAPDRSPPNCSTRWACTCRRPVASSA
ncbi:adenylosuccinate synthetase [Arthrobacter sp. Hiyo4]|nr:adenylosuccinate synthetase [Arthrobacter sp. Hiyo4]